MAEDSPLVCRRWVITGRVQGVGFRWFVLNAAQDLGVRGWVANTWEGAVEVVGLASAETVERFESVLAEGPPAARVASVVSEDIPHHFVESKFFVIKH